MGQPSEAAAKSPKPLPDGYEFHVFLSHSHHDSKEKDEIVQFLESQGYKCCDPDQHFLPGSDVVSNISECLKKSKKVIVIISKDFLDSTYVNFEVGVVIEREGRTKNVTLIPVIKGVELKDVPAKIRRQNVLTWEEPNFKERLLKALEVEELSTLVPAGDIAHGLAWSYFYGFLKLVLPGMRGRVRESDVKRQANLENIPFLDKMMIILPHRGYCPKDLKDDDENLEFVAHLPYTASRAGNKGRDYKSSIYKVTDPDDPKKFCQYWKGDIDFYHYVAARRFQGDRYTKELQACVEIPDEKYWKVLVIAEFATPLMSMYEMEEGQIAGLDKSQLLAQKLLFEEKLKEILDFENNKECHSTYVFCPFDDTRDKDFKPDGWRLSKILANRAFEEIEFMDKYKAQKQKQTLGM